MLTQRQFPKLALIKPTIQSTRSMASIASSASTAKRGDDGIVGVVLVAPGQDEIVCPVITSRSTGSTVITACMWEEATPDRPTSWDDAQRVVDQGNEVASWLKGFLDTDEDVRLVYMDESSERKVNPKYAVDQQPSLVSFADGMQYLLASLTSLNELNRRLPASEGPLGMDRFRPNIIVDGSDPFEEDTWAEIQIGQRPDEFAPTFYGVKHCTRCVVPTTDQSTAEQGGAFAEPLKTLRTFRRDKGLSGKPVFGENLAHLESWDRGLAPSINIGDSVWVLRTKDRGEIGGKKASSGGCVIS